MDRKRQVLLRIQTGPFLAEFLFVPLGGLRRWRGRSGTESRSRFTISRNSPGTFRRCCDRCRSRSSITPRISDLTPTKKRAIMEFPRIASIRAGLPGHHAVFGKHRVHCESEESRRYRHGLLRGGARNGASMVGAPGGGSEYARRDAAFGDARPVFGADGDGERIRARHDAQIPEVRDGQLSPQPRQGIAEGASAAAAWIPIRATYTIAKAAW